MCSTFNVPPETALVRLLATVETCSELCPFTMTLTAAAVLAVSNLREAAGSADACDQSQSDGTRAERRYCSTQSHSYTHVASTLVVPRHPISYDFASVYVKHWPLCSVCMAAGQ